MTKPKDNKLNQKHKMFADEYLIDRNGARAYRAVYGKKLTVGTASVNANRLLKTAKVTAYIAAKQEKFDKKLDISLERVLTELARVAFFDPRKLFDAAGDLLPITALDDDTAAVVSSLDIEELFSGSGRDRENIGSVKKLRMWNKLDALKEIFRHLGGGVQRHEVTGANGAPLIGKAVNPDLSRLSLDELKAYRALVVKLTTDQHANDTASTT